MRTHVTTPGVQAFAKTRGNGLVVVFDETATERPSESATRRDDVRSIAYLKLLQSLSGKLARLQPKAVGPQTAVAVLYQLQNKMDDAGAQYKKVLEIDPKTGSMIKNWGSVSQPAVYGLSYFAGTIYGFTTGGVLFEIHLMQDTLTTNVVPIPNAPPMLQFWGAGSSTIVPK